MCHVKLEISETGKIGRWLGLKGLNDSFNGISAAFCVIEQPFFHLSPEKKALIVTTERKQVSGYFYKICVMSQQAAPI